MDSETQERAGAGYWSEGGQYGMENALRANPRETEYERQIKNLQEAYAKQC